MKKVHLKTLNDQVKEKCRYLRVEQSDNKKYFSFVSDDPEYAKALFYNEHDENVYVKKISDLSLEQWLEKTDEVIEHLNKILPPEEPDERNDYLITFYDHKNNIELRNFKSDTDENAKKEFNRFSDFDRCRLYKLIHGECD